MVLVALLLLSSSTQLISGDTSNCFSPDKDFYPYFGTRTAYDYVHGDIVRPQTSCEPVQIWMLARHGTRYPSEKKMKGIFQLVDIRDRIIENHKNGAGHLCPTILTKLTNWQHDADLKLESAKELVPQGKQDLLQLGQRLRKAFPELLQVDPKLVKRRDFRFRATDTPRTRSSMEAFAEGIFGTSDEIVPPEKTPKKDTLLAPYDNCPAWKKQYKEEHYDGESKKFAAGPEVKKMVEQVNQRLGFNGTLDYGKLKEMYTLCRFETAWHPKNPSVWCALFSNDELKILEYQADLDHYYHSGPGRQWNVKLGCQHLTDMFTRFKEVVDGNTNNHTKGIFYFAHTDTLEILMAALGIDGGPLKPLRADNYSTSQNRKFRTSLLGPFATNVVAVLHKCSGSTSPYAVSFYTVEKLERIEGCQDGLCSWDFIERKFSPGVANCSMDFC